MYEKIILISSGVLQALSMVPFFLGPLCFYEGTCDFSIATGFFFISLYAAPIHILFSKSLRRYCNAISSLSLVNHLTRQLFRLAPVCLIIGFVLLQWLYPIIALSRIGTFSKVYSLVILSIPTILSGALWVVSLPYYFYLCVSSHASRKKIANLLILACCMVMIVHATVLAVYEKRFVAACGSDFNKHFTSVSGITLFFILGCLMIWISSVSKIPNDVLFSSLMPYLWRRRKMFALRLLKYFAAGFFSLIMFGTEIVAFLRNYSDAAHCRTFLGFTFAELVLTIWIALVSFGMIVFQTIKYRRDLRRVAEILEIPQQANTNINIQYYQGLECGLVPQIYKKQQGGDEIAAQNSNYPLDITSESVEEHLGAKLLEESEERCPICWVNFEDEKTSVIYWKPCKHLFHEDCTRSWIKSLHDTCPCCRAKIQT